MRTTKPHTIKKIVIIRNDKLGDFVLSLPSFALAKNALPNTEIVALVPSYTKPLAESYWAIDRVIIDIADNATLSQKLHFLRQFRDEKFDVSITLFSTFRIGLLLFLARVSKRYAPATKIAQIFHNRRLKQRRSLSQKPEFKYNMDLVQFFLSDINNAIPDLPLAPYLSFDFKSIDKIRKTFFTTYDVNDHNPLIFLHPSSGGSASNLTLQQYADLADRLAKQFKAIVILTAGPGELAYVNTLSSLLESTPHRVYESRHGLIDFSMHLMLAKLFISGSTGPLHIAGALNVPTVGFYPKHRSATPLRWQTLNSPERRLAFTPPESSDDQNMSAIDIETVALDIADKLGHLVTQKN